MAQSFKEIILRYKDRIGGLSPSGRILLLGEMLLEVDQLGAEELAEISAIFNPNKVEAFDLHLLKNIKKIIDDRQHIAEEPAEEKEETIVAEPEVISEPVKADSEADDEGARVVYKKPVYDTDFLESWGITDPKAPWKD